MGKVICVYSSSSCKLDNIYYEAAAELGRQIAKRGDTFLYGGGMVGIMGEMAKAVHENNGRVIGVIPQELNVDGIVYTNCDELVVTKGMRNRKEVMDTRSDAFIAMPGGFGTLEELLEIITLKQLGYHKKPIVILNINGFYEELLSQFDQIIEEHFAKEESRKLYFVTEDISSALMYIDKYEYVEFKTKWLTDVEK